MAAAREEHHLEQQTCLQTTETEKGPAQDYRLQPRHPGAFTQEEGEWGGPPEGRRTGGTLGFKCLGA